MVKVSQKVHFLSYCCFSVNGPTVLIFPSKLMQSQDGDYHVPQFPVTTTVYLSTELLSQRNGPRNGGLARVLSGSSP